MKQKWYDRAKSWGWGGAWNAHAMWILGPAGSGDKEEAERVLLDGEERATSGRENVYHGLGMVRLRKGEWDTAKEAFGAGLREARDDVLSHSYGMMLLNEGNVTGGEKTELRRTISY